MRKLTVLLAAILLLAVSAVPAFAQNDDIVEIAVSNDDFSTLVAAVQAADLVSALQGDGPFTVFAPTNAAFADLLAELGLTAEELLSNEALLTQVLLYHVVPGEFFAADVVARNELPTLQGSNLVVDVRGEAVVIDNFSGVIATDIDASNGVIHVIDTVLLPPSDLLENKYVVLADTNLLIGPSSQSTGLVLTECKTFESSRFANGYVFADEFGGWVDAGVTAAVALDYGQPGGSPVLPQCVGR